MPHDKTDPGTFSCRWRIGNDIVDLKAPAARGRGTDLRFMKKILADGEIRSVQESKNPDALLWGFWAAKETAFKVRAKIDPESIFSPRRFQVVLYFLHFRKPSSFLPGRVDTPGGPVAVRIFFDDDHVRCIGAATDTGEAADPDRVLHGWGAIGEAKDLSPQSHRESVAARHMAIRHIARFTGRNAGEMTIARRQNDFGASPPVLYYRGEAAPVDISLSHDERFAAYAFMPQNRSIANAGNIAAAGALSEKTQQHNGSDIL